MKFMVQWYTHPDKRMDVVQDWVGRTPEERGNLGPGLKMIGRWHNPIEGDGVLIVEADSHADLVRYITPWTFVMDISFAPVLDDEESAAALKSGLGG
ncbi:MAG TPA: DUF3303 family protein [Longimicrobiales bacterium]|nr:DUF3303 family protein [Longimicrobiales bacterium]